jgi:hypothetical protein
MLLDIWCFLWYNLRRVPETPLERYFLISSLNSEVASAIAFSK